jgi:glycerol uptake operon antiterminator
MNIVDMVESQIISSIKKEVDIEHAINSNSNICFLLTGNLITTKGYIDKLKKNEKYVFLHLDFIEGLSNTRSAIKYIAQNWKPDGIISTKSNVIKYAIEEGLHTIQRIFLIDRNAIRHGISTAKSIKPDAIEVLPGLMPKIIDELTKEVELPIIVGGLISNSNEIMDALKAGALAVSASNPKLWNENI